MIALNGVIYLKTETLSPNSPQCADFVTALSEIPWMGVPIYTIAHRLVVAKHLRMEPASAMLLIRHSLETVLGPAGRDIAIASFGEPWRSALTNAVPMTAQSQSIERAMIGAEINRFLGLNKQAPLVAYEWVCQDNTARLLFEEASRAVERVLHTRFIVSSAVRVLSWLRSGTGGDNVTTVATECH